MIQFANKETLLCSSRCLSLYQVIFSVKGNFAKKGYLWSIIGVLHSMKVSTRMVTGCFESTGEFFLKIVVSATEFCRGNMLQKIKSDRICGT